MSRDLFPHLFAPLAIRHKTMRNRVFQAPMSVCYADREGFVTRAVIEHYARRAQGGVGMVITEHFAVDLAGRQLPQQVLVCEENLSGLSELAAEIQRHGALAVVQISHAGRYAGPWDEYERRRRLAPSAVPFPLTVDRTVTPQEITREEIAETIRHFGDAARLLAKAGFDGLQLHAASGLLISEFLSPRMNHRTDEYGGSYENRIRFALQVTREVLDRAGGELLIGVHLLCNELLDGGWGLDEALELAQRLEEEGVDFIAPAISTFEAGKHPRNKGLTHRTMHAMKETIAVKRAVTVPVFANGKIWDPFLMEHVLGNGEADAVGLARPLFADPDWVRKVEAGCLDEIRYCPCDPPQCLRTQLGGATCSHWPDEVKAVGYLGYGH